MKIANLTASFYVGNVFPSPLLRAGLPLLMLLASLAFSASGDYAYQAKKYLAQGRYGASYGQYVLALKESRKEADLASEGRILTAMSILATHAMEYEDAKKMLERVNVGSLDKNGKEEFYRTYMEFYNAQSDYKNAFSYSGKEKFKEPTAAYLGESAIAAAGAQNGKAADSLLKKIDKCDSPGQLAYYKARVEDLKSAGKGSEVKELYEKALTHSVEKKKYFTSGMILLRIAQITGSKEYANRSAAVFSELGLAKPFHIAEELGGNEKNVNADGAQE